MASIDQPQKFKDSWRHMQKIAHEDACLKGWHEDDAENPWDEAPKWLCLIHSEVSEAMESLREGLPLSEKLEGTLEFSEELADVVIRIMDMAGALELDVASAIIKKIKHNKTRPYKHGKRL